MAAMAPGARRPQDVVMETALLALSLIFAVGILGSALAIAWKSASQGERG
jgi:hypothetical protein